MTKDKCVLTTSKNRDRIVCAILRRYIESLVQPDALSQQCINAMHFTPSYIYIYIFTSTYKIFSVIETIKPLLLYFNLDVKNIHYSSSIVCVQSVLLAKLSFCQFYYLCLVN